MTLEKKQVILRKLIASEGKIIVPKKIQYDEEGNELPREGNKVIYLAINSDENDYEEINEIIEEIENNSDN